MAFSKTLHQAMNKLQKNYDEEMISFASDRQNREIISHPTGSIMVDVALGDGVRAGLPEGRIVEIYGPESAGKTTMALLAIAARQEEEELKVEENSDYEERACLFIDAEHAFDDQLAMEYGVDLNKLIYINPETSERAMDSLDFLVRTGDIALAVVDSVPALVPAQVEEASFEQQHMAVLARFMSGVTQKMTGPLYNNKTTLVFINQIREQPGKWSPVGVAETTPGGRALKFYSTIRMSIKRGESIKQSGDLIGHQMRIRIVKNKINAPFKEASVNLIYGVGVDKADELFQVALKTGLIKQGGAWFSYVTEDGEVLEVDGELIKAQGRDKMVQMIQDNPMLYGELEDTIRGVEGFTPDETPEEEQEQEKAQQKEEG